MRRVQGRDGDEPQGHDRFDRKGLEFREQLCAVYDYLWHGSVLTKIDAEQDEGKVFREMWSYIERHLPTTQTRVRDLEIGTETA